MSTEQLSDPLVQYRHRMVEVKRVRDAIGAYCLDCQRVIADHCQSCWHWRKSQRLHEQGTESQGRKHKVIMFTLE